ncbi:cache domain-containing protein [Pseudomonas vancouverensis]|uniref:Calcium channel protein n=1 Tax=Pseudomonas vancouverensis TaxID=95300 RepID=A0A1H2NWK8_PSEVA|nr:cache domain-containing protein [Pseudomonas vancouverensis]KAB0496458.1 calcium channel protein [Pseudomonas vancouverensis]TDB64834.1 calcium channel protein [Pseudomonas vancouverensis]SDV09783.1 cytochrome c [Pseudomonas vancouverensis]
MSLYRAIAAVCLSFFSLTGFAQQTPADAYGGDSEHAKALLVKAVTEYKAKGDAALAEFSRQGAYVDGDLYIYVVDTAGVMLASGGPSVSLVGKPVIGFLDDDLKTMFQQAIAQPDDGIVRSAEYRWWNWQHAKVERKRVFYQRVGDRIISVGYYMPRSSPEQAQQLLRQISGQVANDAKSTFERINQHDKQLTPDDLYAFVVDMKTQRFIAHGFSPRLIGTDFKSLRSVDGKPIGEDILKLMDTHESGEIAYQWRNPITGQNEFKRTFMQRVNGNVVAVGCYAAK